MGGAHGNMELPGNWYDSYYTDSYNLHDVSLIHMHY